MAAATMNTNAMTMDTLSQKEQEMILTRFEFPKDKLLMLKRVRDICAAYKDRRVDDIVSNFAEKNPTVIDYGTHSELTPFVGKEFTGVNGVKDYFGTLEKNLQIKEIRFSNMKVIVRLVDDDKSMLESVAKTAEAMTAKMTGMIERTPQHNDNFGVIVECHGVYVAKKTGKEFEAVSLWKFVNCDKEGRPTHLEMYSDTLACMLNMRSSDLTMKMLPVDKEIMDKWSREVDLTLPTDDKKKEFLRNLRTNCDIICDEMKKGNTDNILKHMNPDSKKIRIINWGARVDELPFLGNEYTGIDKVREYFRLVNDRFELESIKRLNHMLILQLPNIDVMLTKQEDLHSIKPLGLFIETQATWKCKKTSKTVYTPLCCKFGEPDIEGRPTRLELHTDTLGLYNTLENTM